MQKTIAGERHTEKGSWKSTSPSFLPLLSSGRFVFCFCGTSGAGCCCPAKAKHKEQGQTGVYNVPRSGLLKKPFCQLHAFSRFKAEEPPKRCVLLSPDCAASLKSEVHGQLQGASHWAKALDAGTEAEEPSSPEQRANLMGEKGALWSSWATSFLSSSNSSMKETWRLSTRCLRPPRRWVQLQVPFADSVTSVCGWLCCLYLFYSSFGI